MRVFRWIPLVVVVPFATKGALTFNQPYLWIFSFWLLACIYAALVSRRTLSRAIWVNLGAVVLALLLLEAYFYSQQEPPDKTRYAGRYTRDYFIADNLLGYGPTKGISATAQKYFADSLVYNVVYSIGPDGLRVAPPYQQGATGCVLFFGDSLTFGEGLTDEQAMPYRVGILSAGRYRVYNFAFHGYGPHQMLAQLEQSVVQRTIACQPQHAIYQAIVPHIARVAGRAFWDKHGPRYRITSGHQVVLSGHFDDTPAAAVITALRLREMQIYTHLLGDLRPYSDADIELYLDVVQQARDAFEREYPGGKFHVLLWHYRGDRVYDQVMNGLRARQLDVRSVDAILPQYAAHPEIYQIGAHDAHPNARADDLIADYVLKDILDQAPQQAAVTDK